jgi:hypothetical protein
VAVRERCCPDCGGELGEEKQELVSITDIPVQPKPEVRLYAVGMRRCQRCGRSVRGQHPEVAADQQGATAHRLGQRVKALGHVLHYQHGVPVRKVPAVIEEMTGLRLTQSALTQDALKQTDGPLDRPTGDCGRPSGEPTWRTQTTPVGGSAGEPLF